MQKKFLNILQLGQNTFWQLLQETRVASEEDILSWQNRLKTVSVQVWLGKKVPQETAAVLELLRELVGEYITHDCASLEAEQLEELVPKQDLEALHIACGFSEIELAFLTNESNCMWFNGVSEFAAPWQAMAEAALALQMCEKANQPLDTWRICWMGKISPLGQSLMQAAIYVPYELFMGVPPWGDPEHSSTDLALKAGAKVFMSREPRLAFDDAHIIYMDTQLEDLAVKAKERQEKKEPIPMAPITGMDDNYVWQKGLVLDESFLTYAMANAPIVTTDVQQNYMKADRALQEERKKLYKAFLVATLHHILGQ